MTFRGRLFLLFALVAVLMVIGSIAAVSNRFGHFTREQLREELEVTPSVFDSFQRSQMDNLINRAVNISTDPSLRGALSTGDRATIVAAANQTHALYDTDLFWILDVRGTVLHRVHSPDQNGDNLLSNPIIQDVRNGYDSGDIWFMMGQLYQVAVVPIRSGNQSLGMLLIGTSFDRGIDKHFADLTGYHLAFARSDTLITSTGDLLDEYALTDAICSVPHSEAGNPEVLPSIPWVKQDQQGSPPKAPFTEFVLNGQRYAGALFELRDVSNEVLAQGMVYESTASLVELLNRIQGALLAVGIAAIVLVLIVTYFLARGLTSPIHRLVDSSKRLGRGDLDTSIPVQTSDEIGTLAQSLDAMRISLKKAREDLIKNERLSTIGRMASTITHDFRQPITTIYGFMQLTALPNTTQDQRQDYAKRVLHQIDRMQSMITELLDFAKGDVILQRREVSIGAFLQDIVTNFEQDHRAKNINLTCTCGWDGIISMDQGRVERVLENIVRNAFQAIDITSGRGEVEVRTELVPDENVISIKVVDNGPGIPEEIRDHLFEPFVTHGKQEGTGLGLSVAARVVEEHGGNILVTSTIGKGTTFDIRLPILEETEVVA
ncbi:HAMP domain-containing protein [bacterium]|nr:HAMP domain-containing protein [bacterium]